MDDVGTSDLPNDRLEAAICTLAAQLAAATCRWLVLIAEFDRREAYKEWGCASTAHWLSWKCALGMVAARQHVRVARSLERLPVIQARFAAGVLSFSKVRAITRVATPESEEELAELAEISTAAQLELTVRTYERLLVDPDRALAQVTERSVTVHHDDDGMVRIVSRLPRDSAERFLTAIDKAAADLPRAVDGDSAESRRADGLDIVADAFLAGSAPRPPTEIVVHVDAADFAAIDRTPVLGRWSCDTSLRLLVHGPDGTTTPGPRTRTIPIALRRALEKRDEGCRFPGCANRRYLHVHHIVHFTPDGPTDPDNCVALCTFHHRAVHEGGWRVVGDSAESRELEFVSPRGRVVREHEQPTLGTVPPPLRHDPRIDDTTITTADGGRLDLDVATTALLSRLRRRRN
jgi:hypothetical protein